LGIGNSFSEKTASYLRKLYQNGDSLKKWIWKNKEPNAKWFYQVFNEIE